MTSNNWLESEVRRGLAMFRLAAFPWRPDDDAMDGTVKVWMLALNDGREWDQKLDQRRVRKAFESMLRRLKTWAVPADFFEHLPSRDPVPSLERKFTEEQRQASLKKLDEITKRFTQ